MPRTIPRVLDGALADDPDREALVTRSSRLTYAQLDAAAHRASHALRELGVQAGDRVAASLPNDVDVVAAFHGAMRLGAVWVGVHRALAAPEQRYLLEDCGASLLLTDDDVDHVPVRAVDLPTWRSVIDAAPATPWQGPDPDPFAPAGIAYTSGTTGRPKGAVHSQHNLLLPGAVVIDCRGYGPDLRKGDCFPFTILNMAVLTTLLVSQAGGTSVVMDRIDAAGVAEWIRSERVTTWNGPPALLHSLAADDDISAADLSSLNEVWTGGADCPESIRSRFEQKFGLPVIATYGLSEAPTVVAIDPGPSESQHRAGASGRVLPHLQVQIRDRFGEEVPLGDSGQICVRAADARYRPMLGYWQQDAATSATLVGDELRTGDVGFLDDDGFLHVRDRLSLMIIRGGANVYPAEVERVLAEFPAVRASAVFGVADERLGERIAAAVEPEPGATVDLGALRAHLTAELARYKVPEQLVVVPALPRNAMGKIVRTDLRNLLDTGGGTPPDQPG
ncbi:MAG: class I adenylate-forming enzyme family protein [Planctomycetia bacterium]